MSLLCSAKLITMSLWADEAEVYDTLRLIMILRMLKSSHFVSRMQALKEVFALLKLIENEFKENLKFFGVNISDYSVAGDFVQFENL